MNKPANQPANTEKAYSVRRSDLPLSCPTAKMALWNSHPRVYLPVEEAQDGRVLCPYCSAVYTLVD